MSNKNKLITVQTEYGPLCFGWLTEKPYWLDSEIKRLTKEFVEKKRLEGCDLYVEPKPSYPKTFAEWKLLNPDG